MKAAITTALKSGARVTLSAPSHGSFPVVLWDGVPHLADGDAAIESLFAAAMEGRHIPAAWGVKLSIEY